MKRLLYVMGGGVSSVGKDGASLLVQVEGEADRRYPFRLLARVILRGDTRIHAAAIWGLMDAGVPVSLQSRSGNPCGFIVPFRPRSGRAQENLECLLERADGRSRCTDWLRARERFEILRALGASRWEMPDLRPAAVEAQVRERASNALNAAATQRRGNVLAEVVEAMTEAGFVPGHLVSLEKELGILGGMTRLLLWDWWFRESTQDRAGARQETIGEWDAVRCQERNRVVHLVLQFTNWLREVEWRATSDMHGW